MAAKNTRKPTNKNNQRQSTKQTKQTKKNSRVSAAQPRDVSALHRRNQIIGWSLLACAALLLCMILFPFESVWTFLHNGILGMFGFLSFLLPALLAYVGITIGRGKSAKPRTLSRTILIFVTAALACAMAYAIGYGNVQHGQNFFTCLGELFQAGTQWKSAGLFSGLIGIPIVALCGAGGAIIVTVIALIVSVLVLTGISMLQVREALAKPTQAVIGGISSARDVAKEASAQRKRRKGQTLRMDPRTMAELELERSEDPMDIPVDDADAVRVAEDRKKLSQKLKENLYRAAKVQEKVPEKNRVDIPMPEPAPVEPEQETPAQPQAKAEQPKAAPAGAKRKARTTSRPTCTGDALLDIPMPGDKPEAVAQERAAQPAAPSRQTENIPAPAPKAQPPAKAPAPKPCASTSALETAMEAAADEDNSAAAAAKAFAKKMAENQSEELAAAVMEQTAESAQSVYRFPPLELLKAGQATNADAIAMELQINGEKLVDILKSFGVQTRVLDISRGPAVTRYELQPAAGVKISKITNLADDIAMNLAASGVRIEAPIPGKAAVGVEVPNQNVSVVKMREILESRKFQDAESRLTVALGRDISGQIVLGDLAKMPHVLIAGSTGSGKSVCINSLIVSLLYKATPDQVKLLMVDPKVVELGIYNGIPHLLVPVVTDPRKAAGALNWAVNEMLNRYKIFADNNVRDLRGYNAMVGEGMVREDGIKLEPMPQIVIIIDELADLMMAAPHEVEDAICRLAQMARAAGMHLVIATQRPSVDVITGVIKANIPSRIAFAVSSQVDSRTILDGSGAEKLLGRGDMLFAPSGAPKPMRVQGCFLEDREVESVVAFVKQKHDTDYDTKVIEEIEKNAAAEAKGKDEESAGISTDPMMEEAIKVVVEAGQASTSLLQRRLRLGYARAGRLIDEMEQMGVVGPHEGSKPRQVLISYQDYLERSMQKNDERNDAQAGVPDALD